MVTAFFSAVILSMSVPVKSESNGVAADTNNHPNSVGILQVCTSTFCFAVSVRECVCEHVLSVVAYGQIKICCPKPELQQMNYE